MTVVQNTATDPLGNPLALATVRITLVTGSTNMPGYTGSGDIVGTATIATDQTGHWSASLTPNSTITPENTYYQIYEGPVLSNIVVPVSGGPFYLSELLVTPPPSGTPLGITGVQVAANGTVAGVRPEINLVAGTNVTITAADNPDAGRVDVTVNATGGGGGGAVDSVFGRTGAVVAQAGDYSANQISGLGTAATQNSTAFDAAGSAATAQTNAETFTTSAVAVETARAEAAEATKLTIADNLSDLTDNAAARGHLGLGSAATQNAAAFDPAGAASTAQSNAIATAEANAAATYIPLSALPLPITSGGTGAGTAAAARTALGLGSAATQNTSAFDVAGAASTAQSNAIAAAEANAAATYLPLAGGALSGPLAMGASKITALANGTVATDAAAFGQIPTTLPPNGAAGGDLTGAYPNPTVTATANFKTQVETVRLDQMAAPTAAVSLNSQKLTSLANGTVSTDAAAFGQIPTSLPPSGSAGGDLTGSYPNPTVTATANFKAQVETVRLDQMAAPTAAVGLNSQKITALANGSVASDAAAFGQIPTAGNVTALAVFGTAAANGSAATYSHSDHVHGAPDAYTWDSPKQRGWSEWNFPPSVGVAVSQNLTSGTIYGISFIAQTANTITKVGVQVVSSASTPTSGQNIIGLYSITGTTATQLTTTGDLGTWGSAGFQAYTFAAGQTLAAGTTYLLLLMSNATTPVHLQGITSDTAAQIGFLNLGLSSTAAPWLKYFVNGTSQTALPSPSFAVSGTTMSATNALAPWACLL